MRILILGAGLAGLQVAQGLSKRLGPRQAKITLVDRSEVHVFAHDLYEVATSVRAEITPECLLRLRETVATPIRDLVDKKRVRFVCEEVADIRPEERRVELRNGRVLRYDYLVVALGSVSNDFGIPVKGQYLFPLKTAQDALVFNCHLDQFFQDLWKRKARPAVNIVIGGGGATGVETAGELVGALNLMCKKYDYPRGKVKVHLVQGGGTLAGFDKRGTQVIRARLKAMGVRVHLNRYIKRVNASQVKLQSSRGAKANLPADIVLWTAGVKVNPLVAKVFGTRQTRGAIHVLPTLQSVKDERVFAAGDNAGFVGEDGHFLPMLGRIAFDQGRQLAENVARLVEGRPLKEYHLGRELYLVPVGGRFALFKVGPFVFKGRLMWWLRRLVALKYNLSILPPWQAFKKWRRGTRMFIQND